MLTRSIFFFLVFGSCSSVSNFKLFFALISSARLTEHYCQVTNRFVASTVNNVSDALMNKCSLEENQNQRQGKANFPTQFANIIFSDRVNHIKGRKRYENRDSIVLKMKVSRL